MKQTNKLRGNSNSLTTHILLNGVHSEPILIPPHSFTLLIDSNKQSEREATQGPIHCIAHPIHPIYNQFPSLFIRFTLVINNKPARQTSHSIPFTIHSSSILLSTLITSFFSSANTSSFSSTLHSTPRFYLFQEAANR